MEEEEEEGGEAEEEEEEEGGEELIRLNRLLINCPLRFLYKILLNIYIHL